MALLTLHRLVCVSSPHMHASVGRGLACLIFKRCANPGAVLLDEEDDDKRNTICKNGEDECRA